MPPIPFTRFATRAEGKANRIAPTSLTQKRPRPNALASTCAQRLR